jgi:hypothetical protein
LLDLWLQPTRDAAAAIAELIHRKEYPVNNIPHKTLALDPHRLVSLWEMQEFLTCSFVLALEELSDLKRNLAKWNLDEQAHWPRRAKVLGNAVELLLGFAKDLQLTETFGRCRRFHTQILYSTRPIPTTNRFCKTLTKAEILSEIEGIEDSVKNELFLEKFVFIPADKAKFFEQDALLGNEVKLACSNEINSEIKEAGNCLAADLNTAAAFHAIRTAEMGMRHLASRLRVVVDRDGKKIKIKDSTWNELIVGINKNIESEKRKPKAERKLKSHFRDYEILADHLNILKDDRNYVMHTQGDYKASEALGVFERVRDFMQRLVKRISLK